MTKAGRPTSYKADYATQAEKLCRLGATDVELADFFEVSVRTVHRWRVENEAFCEATKVGKAEPDDRVERSLFHRAVGYSYEAIKVFQYQGQIIEAPYREHVPPDTTACIFWLKNRRKDAWRDRHELGVGHTDDFARMTDDELRAFLEEGIDKLGHAKALIEGDGKGRSAKTSARRVRSS